MKEKVKISNVIKGLENIKLIYGDKEICILSIMTDRNAKQILFIEFMDYTTSEIEI